jgi:hypothetical protein
MKHLHLMAAAAVGAGMVLVATPGAGASVPADVVVTATVRNHPDNGHGSPSEWADLTFKRTMKIHSNGDGTYALTTTDVGSLITRKGAGSPNNGVRIARTLSGQFSSASAGSATGTLSDNYLDNDKKVFDPKTGHPFSSSEWFKSFFKEGVTGSPFSGHYAFTYKTVDEKWIDADTNDDGQDQSAGDITGKLSSKLVAAGLCQTSSKTLRWTVTNVQGDRARTFKYGVYLGSGKWSSAKTATVSAGRKVTVWTPPGKGMLAVHYYNGYSVYMKTYAKASTKRC